MDFIQIPCCHNFFPVGKRVDVRIKYRVFERCTFVDDDENEFVTQFYPYNQGSETILAINPYCPYCKVELTILFELMSYSAVESSTVLGFIQAKVERLLSLSLSQLELDHNNNDDLGDYSISLDFYRRFERTFDEVTVRAWLERHSSVDAIEEEPGDCTPASEEAIQSLERITLTTSRKEDGSAATCAICLDEQLMMRKNNDEIGRRLPCKHEFHEDCILKWLHTSHYCPLCRFELPTALSSSKEVDSHELVIRDSDDVFTIDCSEQ